jgi:DNA repair protein RecN (Recombination protein N)
MLVSLTIKNYALIRELEIRPSSQLNVVTGETGAGKSIMLGAIGLLLGNRADVKSLWNENEKCLVEGVFDISAYKLKKLFEESDLDYDNQAVIRREISPGGKSRAFINDTPVTLDVMRTVGDRLMHIHSQHETLELANKNFQLGLIDSFAGNAKLVDEYQVAWKQYSDSKSAYEKITVESNTLKQESDYVKFQLDELTKANLREGEQQQLESEQQVQEHAEEIKSNLTSALALIDQSEFSVRSAFVSIRTQLNSIVSYSPNYTKLFERFENLRLELDDLAKEMEREEEHVEFDPARAQETKDRLSTIYQLLKKHRLQEVTQLLELQSSLQKRHTKATNLDEFLSTAKKELEKATKQLQDKAEKLSLSRQKVFTTLAKQLSQLLKELGMPDAVLKIEHQIILPSPSGSDSIELMFSANKGVSPRPLAQVASGGEFSRLMFSIQYILADKTSLPTLILDEIDSGISGEVAMQLGKMMKQMASRHQLIAISHLPQIAAKGDTHYFVYKDNTAAKTISHIRQLTEKERVDEIAQMIAGAKPSAKAIENAKELMEK